MKDEHGRVIRVETAKNVTRFRYDESGALQAKESTRFGRTEYSYVPGRSSGPFARIQSVRQTSDRGTWERNLFYDQEGAMALKTEGVPTGFLRSILRTLQPYFWPEASRPLAPGSVGPVEREGFASVTVVSDGDGGEVQQTTAFGQDVEISTRSQANGEFRIWDSLGAERFETWSEGSLVGARDRSGSILQARLDAFGRPESIDVGGSFVLRFEYEGGERQWIRRHLVDMETGRILGSWNPLHTAGQYGSPEMPGAPTSAALSGFVRDRCDLH